MNLPSSQVITTPNFNISLISMGAVRLNRGNNFRLFIQTHILVVSPHTLLLSEHSGIQGQWRFTVSAFRENHMQPQAFHVQPVPDIDICIKSSAHK